MSSKITDPVTTGNERLATRPSIAAARERLGGRLTIPSRRAPGSVVLATLRDGSRRLGVVLWATDAHCDLWFDDGLARRARANDVKPFDGEMPERLARVAVEVRLFATLAEGDAVRWQRASSAGEGRIVEKCRYGAIVVTRDGKLVAVGFRRLWPGVVTVVA
jgi:hypothetical protein